MDSHYKYICNGNTKHGKTVFILQRDPGIFPWAQLRKSSLPSAAFYPFIRVIYLNFMSRNTSPITSAIDLDHTFAISILKKHSISCILNYCCMMRYITIFLFYEILMWINKEHDRTLYDDVACSSERTTSNKNDNPSQMFLSKQLSP